MWLLGIAYCSHCRLHASDMLEIVGVGSKSVRLLQFRTVYCTDYIIAHVSGSLFTTRMYTMYITIYHTCVYYVHHYLPHVCVLCTSLITTRVYTMYITIYHTCVYYVHHYLPHVCVYYVHHSTYSK